jgi:hypothetical protein
MRVKTPKTVSTMRILEGISLEQMESVFAMKEPRRK